MRCGKRFRSTPTHDYFANEHILSEVAKGKKVDRRKLQHIGTLPRYTPFKNQRGPSVYVEKFLNARGYDVQAMRKAHDLAHPNSKAVYKDLVKFTSTTKPQDPRLAKVLEIALQWMIIHWKDVMYNSEILSWTEILPAIDKTKSPTYPWINMSDNKGELIEEYAFWCYLYKYWDRLKEDDPLEGIWSICPKEEIREGLKLMDNKIRTFVVGPMEHLMSTLRFCHDQNTRMAENYREKDHSLGMSLFFLEWHDFMCKLKDFDVAWETDYSWYDGHIYYYLLRTIARFRWYFYKPSQRTEENKRRVFELYRQVASSILITPSGDLLRKWDGQNSGGINTASDNTLIQELINYMSYIWFEILRGRVPSFETYKANYRDPKMGDDGIMCQKTDTTEEYTFRHKIDFINNVLDMELTVKYEEPRKPWDLTFLSQDTVIVKTHKGKFFVPLGNISKVWATLLNGLKQDTPDYILPIAIAAKIALFWHLESRELLTDLIDYLLSFSNNTPEWNLAKKSLKTDSEISSMFLWRDESVSFFPNLLLQL